MEIDKNKKGKKYPPYTYDISKEKIKEYARAAKCYDSNNFRKESFIAPPMFAVVFQIPAIEPIISDLNIDISKVIQVKQEFEFQEVIRAGDAITTCSKITDIFDGTEFYLITIETNSKNQNDLIVCKGEYTIIVKDKISEAQHENR